MVCLVCKDAETMVCLVCKDESAYVDSGMCNGCYEEILENDENLKAKVKFLRFEAYESRLHFTDVVLVPVDEPDSKSLTIPAHKAVLASRSLVFRTMLEIEKEEIPRDSIKVNDVSYNTLKVFLNYLYTAEACLDEKIARDLLVLAEKYKVKHLKTYCEDFLIDILDWESSVKSYSFAHKHNAKKMLDAALPLILDNMKKFIRSEEYMELVKEDPQLIVEIYEAYMSIKEDSSDDDDDA